MSCCVAAHYTGSCSSLGEPRPRARFTATPAPASSALTGRWRPCGALLLQPFLWPFWVRSSDVFCLLCMSVCAGAHLRRQGECLQSGLQCRAGACRVHVLVRTTVQRLFLKPSDAPMPLRRWSATSAAPAAFRKRAVATRALAPIPTTVPRLQMAERGERGAANAAIWGASF